MQLAKLFGQRHVSAFAKQQYEMMMRERDMVKQSIDTSRTLRIKHRHSGIFMIVEDCEDLADLLKVMIEQRGRKASVFGNVMSAKWFIEQNGSSDISCCIMDLQLPDAQGETLIDWIEVNHPDIPIIVFTGNEERAELVEKKYPDIKAIRKNGGGSTRQILNALALA